MEYVTQNGIDTLESVQQFLDQIPNINNGGCGIAAFSIYKWLQKTEEIDDKFNFLYYRDYQYNDNCSRINSFLLSLVVPAHIGYIHNGIVIDSTGIINKSEYNFEHIVDSKFLIETIKSPYSNGWNPRFDRSFIRVIEYTLDINLSEIK